MIIDTGWSDDACGSGSGSPRRCWRAWCRRARRRPASRNRRVSAGSRNHVQVVSDVLDRAGRRNPRALLCRHAGHCETHYDDRRQRAARAFALIEATALPSAASRVTARSSCGWATFTSFGGRSDLRMRTRSPSCSERAALAVERDVDVALAAPRAGAPRYRVVADHERAVRQHVRAIGVSTIAPSAGCRIGPPAARL